MYIGTKEPMSNEAIATALVVPAATVATAPQYFYDTPWWFGFVAILGASYIAFMFYREIRKEQRSSKLYEIELQKAKPNDALPGS